MESMHIGTQTVSHSDPIHNEPRSVFEDLTDVRDKLL